MSPRQCAILVGGQGTRLGALAATRPKPLLPVGGKPFLDVLLWHASRFGFERALLLAGHQADAVVAYAQTTPLAQALEIAVAVETEPLGTAGALRAAGNQLDESFLLLNGDSLFDFNWLALGALAGAPEAAVVVALRRLDDVSRSGVALLDGDRVTGFQPRGGAGGGVANGGVYLVRRSLLDALPAVGSLEVDVLPGLAARGQVRGRVFDGFFLDIGVPEAFERAQALVPASLRRPAVIFDERCAGGGDVAAWAPGARAAIKSANDAGWFVFVAEPSAADRTSERARLQSQLRADGAHVDDFYAQPMACGRAWTATDAAQRLQGWPIDAGRSLLVERPIDIDAVAARCGGPE